MSIQNIGLKAYGDALKSFNKAEKKMHMGSLAQTQEPASDFATVLKGSLEKVNNLQTERSQMISAFASGETQNVHELMISMQKAGLAMNMTAAVRNKVMEAYKELTRMSF